MQVSSTETASPAVKTVIPASLIDIEMESIKSDILDRHTADCSSLKIRNDLKMSLIMFSHIEIEAVGSLVTNLHFKSNFIF